MKNSVASIALIDHVPADRFQLVATGQVQLSIETWHYLYSRLKLPTPFFPVDRSRDVAYRDCFMRALVPSMIPFDHFIQCTNEALALNMRDDRFLPEASLDMNALRFKPMVYVVEQTPCPGQIFRQRLAAVPRYQCDDSELLYSVYLNQMFDRPIGFGTGQHLPPATHKGVLSVICKPGENDAESFIQWDPPVSDVATSIQLLYCSPTQTFLVRSCDVVDDTHTLSAQDVTQWTTLVTDVANIVLCYWANDRAPEYEWIQEHCVAHHLRKRKTK